MGLTNKLNETVQEVDVIIAGGKFSFVLKHLFTVGRGVSSQHVY